MTARTRTRADMCPGLCRPWPAHDGLLVRIRLMGGRLPTAALAELSAVSKRHGDGQIHLTGRANLQLRGLPGEGGRLSAAASAAIVETGLIPSRTHELVRNVLASPQTGLAGGRADLRPVVDRLDSLLCADPGLARLPGRFLFTLDDGRGDLVDRLAGAGKRGTDLGCVALGDDEAQLRVGNRWGRVVPVDEIARSLVDMAARFLDARGTGADAPWHIRELVQPLHAAVPADSRLPARTAPLPYGHVPGGVHVAAAGATLTPDLVDSLLGQADSYVVVTPWRGVLVPAVPS